MKIYSQRDPQWGNEKLGFSESKIKDFGCKLTSFAMLDGRNPSELNTVFKEKGCFSGDLLIDEKCAEALNWTLLPRTTDKPSTLPCIAEVDMSPAPGKQQHFVVWQEGGIIDPWTGQARSHEMYPTVSFRNFVIKELMNKDFVKAIEKIVSEDYGDNLNDKEQKDAAKKLIAQHDLFISASQNTEHMMAELQEANNRIKSLTNEVGEANLTIEALNTSIQAIEKDCDNASLDSYSLTELAGAFFRKLIQVKK